MKILHTEASCGWGGQEIRILEEAKGLIGRGHHVTLACPPQAQIAKQAARYGVPVIPLPVAFKTLAAWQTVRRHLAAHRYDVVNTHSSADSWLVALACAALRRPPALVRTRHISAPVAKNFATRWLYRQARMIVTTGEQLREELIERLGLEPARVVSVPTGIAAKRFTPADDKAAAKKSLGLDPALHYIGIVATLRSWKGHLYLLEAFAKLQHPKARLLIVGGGPMQAPLEERIATLGITERVILTGQRNDPERWLQAMDVFCLPSYANEGVPQALVQAMLCALPIVTTAVGAIPEAVTHEAQALIVPSRNALALAQALERLLDDPACAARLGENARARACERFALSRMLSRMEEIFLCATSP